MRKLERRAETVEAMQYHGTMESFNELHKWSNQAVRRAAQQRVVVSGRNVKQNVEAGCWVVKDRIGYHVITPDELEEHFYRPEDPSAQKETKTVKKSASKTKAKE